MSSMLCVYLLLNSIIMLVFSLHTFYTEVESNTYFCRKYIKTAEITKSEMPF